MKTIFGIWTVMVALAVSVVAAYFSIIGLTAIFAAAVIPIVIMGVSLEVAKITTAIWLHTFWHQAATLIKIYLTSATVILMLITSMGIFGFLSKAHIEQNANSGSIIAQISRVEQRHLGEQQIVARAREQILSFDQGVVQADLAIQQRIGVQERLIADAVARLETDIATQNQLMSQGTGQLLQTELTRIQRLRDKLSTAQTLGDNRAVQTQIGVKADGVIGPATRAAITKYTQQLTDRQSEIVKQLQQQATDPAAQAIRTEIARLQTVTNQTIARAQEAINAFRTQMVTITTVDNSSKIIQQQQIIEATNLVIGQLLERKFELEGELRILEVEVGPVKYIAEMVYGESNPAILEKAVRWVIIILVVVFDPLAIVLVISGLSIIHTRKTPIDNPPELLHTDTIDVKPEEPDLDTDPTLAPPSLTPQASTSQDTAMDDTVEKSEQPTTVATKAAVKTSNGIQINRTLNDK